MKAAHPSEGSEKPLWLQAGDSKRRSIQAMFAQIAPGYDKLNDQMSLNLHRRWRACAAAMLELKPGETVLDLCAGTGDFLVPLRRLVGSQGRLVAADFCLEMLIRADAKDPDSACVGADACRLPFGDGVFDGVTVGWGIRNVADIDLAHREIHRVLKPGGRFVSIDMAMPKNPISRFCARVVERHLLPFLGGRLGYREFYSYLAESANTFKSREDLKQSMERAGFSHVRYRDLFMGGICIHFGLKAGGTK